MITNFLFQLIIGPITIVRLTVKSLLISKNERSLPITIKLMHYTFRPEHVHK